MLLMSRLLLNITELLLVAGFIVGVFQQGCLENLPHYKVFLPAIESLTLVNQVFSFPLQWLAQTLHLPNNEWFPQLRCAGIFQGIGETLGGWLQLGVPWAGKILLQFPYERIFSGYFQWMLLLSTVWVHVGHRLLDRQEQHQAKTEARKELLALRQKAMSNVVQFHQALATSRARKQSAGLLPH
jgi:hypothetical protein